MSTSMYQKNLKKLTAELKKRLEENYDGVSDFVAASKIPLTGETVGRFINRGGRVSIPVLILLLIYFGYAPFEIKEKLIGLGDKDYSSLIVDQEGFALTRQEESLVLAFRKLKNTASIVSQVELIAKSEGVDISKELRQIKRMATVKRIGGGGMY